MYLYRERHVLKCKVELLKSEMEGSREQQFRSRVVKVDSAQIWDSYAAQATDRARPIVVHFSASWCVPSIAMNPYFEELAANFPDALFLNVDVDDVKEVATRFEVKAMPTFLLMKNGSDVVDKFVGANREEMRRRIASFVESSAPRLAS